jgi:hypothetical protein
MAESENRASERGTGRVARNWVKSVEAEVAERFFRFFVSLSGGLRAVAADAVLSSLTKFLRRVKRFLGKIVFFVKMRFERRRG